MDELDDTDRTILRLLLEDARRSWRDIADEVDLSPPAVSDRVDRLQEIGVIRSFTAEIDRTALDAGSPVLVTVRTDPGAATAVSDGLLDADAVEHVFTTADERVVFTATVEDGAVRSLLAEHVALDEIQEFDVDLLTDRAWNPGVAEVELALTCAECGNTVTSEGTSARIGGELYHFCCESCEATFTEMYEDLREGAES